MAQLRGYPGSAARTGLSSPGIAWAVQYARVRRFHHDPCNATTGPLIPAPPRNSPLDSGDVAGKGTPATALAARRGIAHALHPYEHDPSTGSYGLEAAEALGQPPQRVFKTLVAEVDGELTVAVLPVSAQLDLKALASARGGKKAKLADPATAERATGYVTGGISPLGLKKRLPVVVDTSVHDFSTVFCSAGRRGLQIELAPADLVQVAGAETARITAE